MFGSKKRQQRLIEMVSMVKPTSKVELKRTCLYLCRLDVDKAEKMYDFLVKGMDNLPDIEPSQQPFIQRFGEQADGILGWLRENQDILGQGIDFVKGLVAGRKNGGAVPPATPLPPING